MTENKRHDENEPIMTNPCEVSVAQIELARTWRVSRRTSASKSHASFRLAFFQFPDKGLINDRLYAEAFSQSRWSSSSWGPRGIKQALFKKGVSQADAEKAVELVFKDNDSAGDQKSSIGLSKHSMDHLYTQASKQWLRDQDVPKETRKSRIVRWLQYHGFDWDVINFILRKLDRQDPP